MAGFDWNGLGNDIHNMVQDAVNSREFTKLNNELNHALDKAFGGLGSGVREAGRAAGQAMNEAARNIKGQSQRTTADRSRYSSGWQGDRYGHATGSKGSVVSDGINSSRTNGAYRSRPVPYYKSPLFVPTDGKMAGAFVMAIGGFVFAGIFGLSFLLALLGFLAGLLTGGAEIGGLVGSGISLLGSLTLGTAGAVRISKIQRFRSYIRTLGGRAFCELKELASATGKSLKYVQKDIRKLVDKRWFTEGHFDRQGTCLMVTDAMYQTYMDTEQRRAQLLEQERQKAQQMQEEQERIPKEVRDVLEAGEAYIKRIRKCNDDIPGVEISNKIFRIEELVQQIFARVKEYPEMVSDIRKMMEYYLPTTIKLLDAYTELDAQSVQGEHITNSKQEIEQVLDTLNIAFEKLLDSLFRDKAWDVSADISVLQTMLAQEGLTNSDFRRETK